MSGDLLGNIKQCAADAEFEADLAILHNELPEDHPAVIALKAAHNALGRIRLAVELSEMPPMEAGEL